MRVLYAFPMTISEQLHFSVLSAPVATLDRRALSQAWYSALYGNGGNPAHFAEKTQQPQVRYPGVPRQSGGGTPERPACERASRGCAEAAPSAAKPEAVPGERRAPRSALARKIERAFLRPHGGARKASFSMEGEHGRVHVLLRSSGAQLKIVAICSQKARTQVAAALAQARYALALRGIDLDAEMRSAASC